jgi:hypothetical protein
MCSARFSGADGRILYRVGHPFSEWVGEATLVRDASGSWHVANFKEYPPWAAELQVAPSNSTKPNIGLRPWLRVGGRISTVTDSE